jgi:hypothetical protein
MGLKWRRPAGLRPNGPFASSSFLNRYALEPASSLFLAPGPFGRNAEAIIKRERLYER